MSPLDERHEAEQYFFATATRDRLADILERYAHPCCICTPTVGRELARRRHRTAVLDIDERFRDVPGFRRYDLTRPEWLGEDFGVILCDPPFFNVSLSQLHDALHRLARYDFHQPLIVSYLERRSESFLRAFARFGLEPTSLFAEYETVVECERNDIRFFANFELEGSE